MVNIKQIKYLICICSVGLTSVAVADTTTRREVFDTTKHNTELQKIFDKYSHKYSSSNNPSDIPYVVKLRFALLQAQGQLSKSDQQILSSMITRDNLAATATRSRKYLQSICDEQAKSALDAQYLANALEQARAIQEEDEEEYLVKQLERLSKEGKADIQRLMEGLYGTSQVSGTRIDYVGLVQEMPEILTSTFERRCKTSSQTPNVISIPLDASPK